MSNTANISKNFNRSPQAAHPVDIACLSAMLVLSDVMQVDTIASARESGNAIWQAVLIACMLGGVMAMLLCYVLRAYLDDAERDWFTLTKKLSGPAGASISAAAILILFLDTARMTITSMETTAANEYLDRTPMLLIGIVFLLVCAIAAHKRLRGVVRISRILSIGSAFIVALILLIALSSYDVNRLFPLGGHGIPATIHVGVSMAGDIFSDIFIICLILPVQRGQYGVRKGIFYSLMIIGPFLVILALCYAMAYPVGGNHYLIPPIQQMAAVSEFGRYVQRLSPLLVFLWTGAFLICASSMLFGASRAFAALFHIEDERPMIWPFAMILLLFSVVPNSLLPPILRDRLPGLFRLGLFAIALLPALLGRLFHRRRRTANAA